MGHAVNIYIVEPFINTNLDQLVDATNALTDLERDESGLNQKGSERRACSGKRYLIKMSPILEPPNVACRYVAFPSRMQSRIKKQVRFLCIVSRAYSFLQPLIMLTNMYVN